MGSKKQKILLMGSGEGTNAKNLLELAKSDKRAEFLGIICDREGAKISDLGKVYKIPSFVFTKPNEEKILKHIQEQKPDWIFLVGYKSVLGKKVIDSMKTKPKSLSRIINIHPSLLPAFSGLRGYEQAYAYGVKVSGVTIHFVDEGLDTGPIIAQKHFYRKDSDSLEDFIQKGKCVEKELFYEVFETIVSEKISDRLDESRWINGSM